MTLLMNRPVLNGLPAPFDADRFPQYEETNLAQRQEIWKQYKSWMRMENTTSVMLDESLYGYVQQQLNLMYANYISRFSSTALSKEDCFV